MPFVLANLPFFEIGPDKVFINFNPMGIVNSAMHLVLLLDDLEIDAKTRLYNSRAAQHLTQEKTPPQRLRILFGPSNRFIHINFDVFARLSLEDQVRLTFWIMRCRQCFFRICLCEPQRPIRHDYLS